MAQIKKKLKPGQAIIKAKTDRVAAIDKDGNIIGTPIPFNEVMIDPVGGTPGDVLTKKGGGGYWWQPVPKELPTGGIEGQVLVKGENGPEWATLIESPIEDVTGDLITMADELLNLLGVDDVIAFTALKYPNNIFEVILYIYINDVNIDLVPASGNRPIINISKPRPGSNVHMLPSVDDAIGGYGVLGDPYFEMSIDAELVNYSANIPSVIKLNNENESSIQLYVDHVFSYHGYFYIS